MALKKYNLQKLAYASEVELSEIAASLRSQIKYANRKKVSNDKLKLLEIELCYVQNEIAIRNKRKKSFRKRGENVR
tara:strand:- start:318 stop:545 length:228 start_codon:yes stop_codon:yes gene_type:complete